MLTVKMKEIRPRKQHMWKFGLAVLILMSVFLFKYNFKLDSHVTSSINVASKITASSNTSFPLTTNQSEESALLFSDPSQKEVAEVHNVVFVKVHKSASSVVQNILLRYSLSRKLNVLLPVSSHLINESGSYINKKLMVPLPKGQNYNFLCNHLIFDKKEVQRFFPNSTKYIGILRHPLSQMSSALYYYAKRYKKSRYPLAFLASPRNPLRAFLTKPFQYDLDPPRKSFVNNRMSIDFGFPVSKSFESDKKDKKKISKFIANIDKTFGLILIVELFEESLLLLRRLLQWKTKDILYLKLNVNADQQHKYDQSQFSETDRTLHKKWAPIDYALYEHFKTKIKKTIEEEGEDFQQELDSFRNIEDTVQKFCESKTASKLVIEGTRWSKRFHITKVLCNLMKEGETSMVALVRKRQQKRLRS